MCVCMKAGDRGDGRVWCPVTVLIQQTVRRGCLILMHISDISL